MPTKTRSSATAESASAARLSYPVWLTDRAMHWTTQMLYN